MRKDATDAETREASDRTLASVERIQKYQLAATYAGDRPPEPFGRVVARFRKRANLTQRQLDEALEIVLLGADRSAKERGKSSFTAQTESGRIKPPERRAVNAISLVLGMDGIDDPDDMENPPDKPPAPANMWEVPEIEGLDKVPPDTLTQAELDRVRELEEAAELNAVELHELWSLYARDSLTQHHLATSESNLWMWYAAPERLHALDPELFAWHRGEVAEAQEFHRKWGGEVGDTVPRSQIALVIELHRVQAGLAPGDTLTRDVLVDDLVRVLNRMPIVLGSDQQLTSPAANAFAAALRAVAEAPGPGVVDEHIWTAVAALVRALGAVPATPPSRTP